MKLNKLIVRGLRGFSEEQTIDLNGDLVIFSGSNGCGKTSIGEAIEWALYGRTLKRMKGDEISKREYQGSYQNAHFGGPGLPFVELHFTDSTGAMHVIRRELKADETSVLRVEGNIASSLDQFKIDAIYDRPLVLQHTLQDFIFMKPKNRYEVLSGMLGLEGLIEFRKAVEESKTLFSNNLPRAAKEAQSRALLLVGSMEREPILKPIVVVIRRGDLTEAKKQFVQVTLGRLPSGTDESDILPALEKAKTAKERSKLDWGRFSLGAIASPDDHQAVAQLIGLKDQLGTFGTEIERVRTRIQSAQPETILPARSDFYTLGIELVDSAHPENCPFCGEDSLKPERLAELKAQVESVGSSSVSFTSVIGALAQVRNLLSTQSTTMNRITPTLPSESEVRTIGELATNSKKGVDDYLEASRQVGRAVADLKEKKQRLDEEISVALMALGGEKIPEGQFPGLPTALQEYSDAVRSYIGVANGYAATYATLDPVIKDRLASEEDVRFLDLLIRGFKEWNDIRIDRHVVETLESLQDLIRRTRLFIETKQKEILKQRDNEIKAWYRLLSGASDVGYEQIVPSTDNLELRAKTFTKQMMAAPNLSQCQLNCVGLAVYLATATRPESPCRFVLFDDPIQSMDDDHTEAFKKTVIQRLLTSGFQVLLLTHMDTFAGDVERLYRASTPALYKMESYTLSGPNVVPHGPAIKRLLAEIKRDKDSVNDAFRKQAALGLRQFVERFVKDLYSSETGQSVSKRFENQSWPELRNLLRQCKKFEPVDEAILEDTHEFASPYLHTDDSRPQTVPSPSHLNPHHAAMGKLYEKYVAVFNLV
jgi:hypothetical protein